VRALVLVLALFAARPVHGEESQVIDVHRATVTLQDGSARQVEGGCWLSTERCVLTARRLKQLEAENASLKKDAGTVPLKAVLVALSVGLGAGFAAAKLVR
jgi:hypothetical protein